VGVEGQSQPQLALHPVDVEGQIVMAVLKWSLACVVVIYVLMTVGLAIFQRRLQYFPGRRLVAPAHAGISGVEDLRLTTDDGEVLVAWYVPAKDGHPLILYFHGNGGALVDRVPRIMALMASGYGLLAISYRGYGGSTGSPTQKGLMEDSETAYLEARARGYEGYRIVLIRPASHFDTVTHENEGLIPWCATSAGMQALATE
jgi:fermentation-respiration switch protein FrsA (DUF1100 family)